MSFRPLPASHTPARRTGAWLVSSAARTRTRITPGGLARRRIAVTVTKWLLPLLALGLMTTVALWPELDQTAETARVAFRRVSGEVGGAQLTDARYHGVDEKGRPYTVTAATARQSGADRVDLTNPQGDVTLQDGTWLMLQSKQGVFLRQRNQLDLSHDVTLYRDDGTTLVTRAVSIDLKNGAAASSDPTHAEGPFGTLESQGFTVLDKGANILFTGPAKVVLNGATH
jgi:lipopolysaccharide export system protein LptC